MPIGEPLLLEPRQQLAPLWAPILAPPTPLLVPLFVPQSPSMLGISIEIIEVISYLVPQQAELHRPCAGLMDCMVHLAHVTAIKHVAIKLEPGNPAA